VGAAKFQQLGVVSNNVLHFFILALVFGSKATTGKDVAGRIIEFVERNAHPGKTKTRGRG